jgi:hypothetical protein
LQFFQGATGKEFSEKGRMMGSNSSDRAAVKEILGAL